MYKKIFMSIAAVAALTLVSCSSDDLNSLSDNSSKNEAISFDGYLGRSAVSVNGTRGSELDLPALQSKGFGVFGNYTSTDVTTTTYGENLFKNQKVTYDASAGTPAWTYTPVKYWPTVGHIDFLAYAPYLKGTTLNNNTSIKFDVANKVDEQKDLLWANATSQTKEKGKVTFHFAHALSRLGYSVKLKNYNSESKATITLNKITLAGSATVSTEGAFYTNGTIDLSKTSSENPWTQIDKNTKQNFDWFSSDNTSSGNTLSNNDDVIKSTEYLFVIPQDFSGTDKLYVKVEYTISYSDGSEPITYKVYQQITNNFLKGKAYTINLTIGLTPIEFAADVTPWTDTDNKNTDIPIDSWK